MKKVFLLILSVFLLTGCMNSKEDNLKGFKDYNSKKESYKITGSMSLVSNEDEFTYDVEVAVKDNEYYKVTLTNTINNHVQVILKNADGVYVVTPNLNKSFKFQSEWPSNSSQAYLLEALVRDINNDSEATITETDDGFTINAKVNYPNNSKLDNEIITTDKDYNVKKVEVMNVDGNAILTVNMKNIDYKPNFDETYFDLDEIIQVEDSNTEETTKKTEEDCMQSCTEGDTTCEDKCKSEDTESTSNILDEIIYPLYVPTDTYLSSKDTVSTDTGNRVILTFAGTDPFILVEEAAIINDEMEIIPVNGEPLMMGATVGALTSNSLYWTSEGIDYYLTSNTLDSNEMMTIAESITNGASLVASTK